MAREAYSPEALSDTPYSHVIVDGDHFYKTATGSPERVARTAT